MFCFPSRLRIAAVILVVCMLNATTTPRAVSAEGTYTNPVIAGDFPDPTIIRVGDTYFAAGTSCDFAPNYPLYQSSDLVNWQRIGSVFPEPPAWTSDDFWAPELFYHDGTFFMYYTAKRKDNRIACIGVATTTDIHQGFTDHGIIIEWGDEAIDAFVFKDDDGKRYITWKAYGLTAGREIEILGSQLSDDGLSLVGESFTLTDHSKGWRGGGDEGQCIVKRGDYYYLIYSIGGCCDNRCDYRVRVARSKDLQSGWEQYPTPILQGGETWRCSGHGTLVTTADGRDFYLYHAYHHTDFEFIGRQGLLDELVWDEQTGWPRFKQGDTPSVTAALPFPNTEQNRETIWIDSFSTNENIDIWNWDINESKPSIQVADGKLKVAKNHDGIGFIGLNPKTGDYSLQAEVLVSETQTGIGVYSTQQNWLSLMANRSQGRLQLALLKTHGTETETLSALSIDESDSVFLKYEVTQGRYFRFYFSTNGVDWRLLALQDETLVDARFIVEWGFAPRSGLLHLGESGTAAEYSSVKLEYNFD